LQFENNEIIQRKFNPDMIAIYCCLINSNKYAFKGTTILSPEETEWEKKN